VLDVHAALAKRGLRLLLYWTCDGPGLDPRAHEGLGWPENFTAGCSFTNCSAGLCECAVPPTFLERWPAVLREFAVRYGEKVSGWWIDGCFRRPYGYNESTLEVFREAVRAGNPRALVALNNGVHHPIGSATAGDRISNWEDFTAGESDDFTEIPRSRFVSGPPSDPTAANVTAQWHTLSFLGPQWAAPGLCVCCKLEVCLHTTCEDPACKPLSAADVGKYTRAVNSVGGVVTIDLQLLRNGSMNAQQVDFLREAWRPSLKHDDAATRAAGADAQNFTSFPLFVPTAATTVIKTDDSIRDATSARPSRYQVFSNQQWPSCCIRPTAGCVGPPTPTNLTLANLSLPDFKKWRIRTNPGLTFDGSVVATLYGFGLIPSYEGMGPGGGK
jgi:hypothetical protein